MPGAVVAVLASALLVLLLAEWASSRLASDVPGTSDAQSQRAENVVVLPKDPACVPPPNGKPEVWVVGNSHTYSLPGSRPGYPLRTDLDGVLIDELALRVAANYSYIHADFYLLAYPNFLPFEMLTRVGYLLDHGYRPKIVFLGLTCAILLAIRGHVTKSTPPIVMRRSPTAFNSRSLTLPLSADEDVLKEIAAQQVQARHDDEVERLKSDSDRVDELAHRVGSRAADVIWKSAELRGGIFFRHPDRPRQRVMGWTRTTVKYSDHLVAADFEFNVKRLWTTCGCCAKRRNCYSATMPPNERSAAGHGSQASERIHRRI